LVAYRPRRRRLRRLRCARTRRCRRPSGSPPRTPRRAAPRGREPSHPPARIVGCRAFDPQPRRGVDRAHPRGYAVLHPVPASHDLRWPALPDDAREPVDDPVRKAVGAVPAPVPPPPRGSSVTPAVQLATVALTAWTAVYTVVSSVAVVRAAR